MLAKATDNATVYSEIITVSVSVLRPSIWWLFWRASFAFIINHWVRWSLNLLNHDHHNSRTNTPYSSASLHVTTGKIFFALLSASAYGRQMTNVFYVRWNQFGAVQRTRSDGKHIRPGRALEAEWARATFTLLMRQKNMFFYWLFFINFSYRELNKNYVYRLFFFCFRRYYCFFCQVFRTPLHSF